MSTLQTLTPLLCYECSRKTKSKLEDKQNHLITSIILAPLLYDWLFLLKFIFIFKISTWKLYECLE